MATSFRCRECGVAVTGRLEPLADTASLDERAGGHLLPVGVFAISDGETGPETTGDRLVNIADLRGTRPHPDPSTRNGCCGPDGLGGFNLVCAQGHAIGIERRDCWLAHHAILAHDKVTPSDDA